MALIVVVMHVRSVGCLAVPVVMVVSKLHMLHETPPLAMRTRVTTNAVTVVALLLPTAVA